MMAAGEPETYGGPLGEIPEFDQYGNLPPGSFDVSLAAIEARLTWTGCRRTLFEGLVRALANLQHAGVKRVWIGGGFVTKKPEPNDVDGCWEVSAQVDADQIDPVFWDLRPPRRAMKAKYGVDFLITGTSLADAGGATVQDFFQFDRDGNRKGILSIRLGDDDDS